MRLRYDGVCRLCGVGLPARTEAVYERSTKTVRCATHLGPPAEAPTRAVVEPGSPGASARREFERRSARREQRLRDKHPRIGGLLHALSDEPQSTTVWDTGARGEESLGRRLNNLASDQLRVLHDLRIPGTRANIDHLAVTPRGVFVVDAKKYVGRPRLTIEGGLLRPRVEKLRVGTRDCTKVVDGVLKQMDIVRDVVDAGVPVWGVLCFIDSDWPLVGGSFTTRDVEVLWPKRLFSRLTVEGPAGAADIAARHRVIAASLPPA